MKAKVVCAIISLFFLVLPGFSAAAEEQKGYPFSKERITETHKTFAHQSLEFGFMYWNLSYEEDLPAPMKSTEKGWLPGFYLGWNYNKKNAVYSKVLLEFSFGNVTYDGTDQSGTTPITFSDDNHQFFFRGEWDIGYNFAITKDISIKPYTGYGYRHWDRGKTGFQTGTNILSIQERYYWHYIPVGVAAEFDIGKNVVIEPNVGARFMFYGKMAVEFSDLDSGYNTPDVKLGNRIGYYAEIPVRYKFSQFWSVVIKPWYAYDAIGQSDTVDLAYNGTTVGSLYEPASTTHQYGVNVGLSVSY